MVPLAVVLARSDPYAAAVFAPCVVGATIATASIHIALPRPGRRRDLRRRGKGNAIAGMFEFATTLAWSATTWLLLEWPLFAPLTALVALGAPLAAWRLGRERRSDFSAA